MSLLAIIFLILAIISIIIMILFIFCACIVAKKADERIELLKKE